MVSIFVKTQEPAGDRLGAVISAVVFFYRFQHGLKLGGESWPRSKLQEMLAKRTCTVCYFCSKSSKRVFSNSATPSSSLLLMTLSAKLFTLGTAFSMATLSPEIFNIDKSL